MSDELLDRLAALGRAQKPDDGWDEVLDGERSAQSWVELRAEDGADLEELNALADAAAPLDAEQQAAWVARLRPALDAAGSDAPSERPDGLDSADIEEPDEHRERAEPIDLASRRQARRWGIGVVTVLTAVAAAVLLWLRPRPPHTLGGAGPPLPEFALVVRNDSVSEIRGDESPTKKGEPARLGTDSQLHWMLAPVQPVTRPVAVAVVAVGDDGACVIRPPIHRRSSEGVVELRGTVADVLGLDPGTWTVHVAMFAEQTVPTDARCGERGALPCDCDADRPSIAPWRDAADAAGWVVTSPYRLTIER